MNRQIGTLCLKVGIDAEAVSAFLTYIQGQCSRGHIDDATAHHVTSMVQRLAVVTASPDANVERNRQMLLDRNVVGLKKYGVTTERTDLNLSQWLQHILEELLDAANYVQAAKMQAEQPRFQARVRPWLLECFGEMIAGDREERNHRFLEEALELVQACGCTQQDAHQLVDYVFGRPVGEPSQEVGGVMVTLAALCLANELDMHSAGETELARIWTKVEQIRAKQAAKPKYGPLPGPSV